MKRIGILLMMLLLCAFTVIAQDNNATPSTDNSATQNQNRDAAARDKSAADQEKANAKDESSKSAEERDKVIARLDDSSKILNELLTAPDKGIPDKVFESAKCVAVVPSMVKGGFVFGAEHGRGVATCRTNRGWSAPAFFVITGGSWGLQIGVQSADMVLLIMNQQGMNDLLSSKFKLGANGSVAAGPVGRDASRLHRLEDESGGADLFAYARSLCRIDPGWCSDQAGRRFDSGALRTRGRVPSGFDGTSAASPRGRSLPGDGPAQ